MNRVLLVFLLLTFSALNSRAVCNVTIVQPTNREIGDSLRNPIVAGQDSFLISIHMACDESAMRVYLKATNASFVSSTNASSPISYKVSVDPSPASSGSSSQTPTAGMDMFIAKVSSSVSDFSVRFKPSAVANLQSGMYGDGFLLAVVKDDPSGQPLAGVNFTVSGIVPDDCQVSFLPPPDAATIGAILKSPALDSFAVPVSISCKTYKASLTVKTLNGSFKGTAANSVTIPYQLQVQGTDVDGLLVSSTAAVGVWVAAGTVLTNSATMANLVITPSAVNNVPPDTYSETVYLRVNGP
jgi:hypothetical protein